MKTIATFMNEHEAHMLRIKLEDYGVPAIVSDDLTAGAAPYLTNAIGGIRVQVPDEDLGKAQAVLQEKSPPVDLRDDLTCPKCGSTNIAQALHEKRSYLLSFVILIVMMLPVPLIKRRYCCNDCNHLWKHSK